MFCPNCKVEYRHGFATCADCDVRLVRELPEELEEPEEREGNAEYIEFKPVLSTYNNADIAFIKSILDAEDINYYFKGENVHFARPGGQPAILMVQAGRVKEVQELLQDLEIHFNLFS